MTEDREVQSIPEPDQPISLPVNVTFTEKYGISPVLFAFLSLIIIFVLYQIIGGITTALIFGLKPTPDNVNGFRIATGVGQILLILFPTLILVRFISSAPKDYMRIRTPDIRLLFVPLVGIFSLQQLLQIYLFVQEKIPLPQSIERSINQFKELLEEAYKLLVSSHSIPELLFVVVVVGLIPAFTEELLFRGLIQRCFEKGSTPMRGAVLTGIIFGAYHLNPFSIVPLVILGIYLGFLVMRANNIWVSVSAHFYNNAIACIAVYLNQEDSVITGNPGDMSIGYMATTFLFFLVVFVVSTYYFIALTKQPSSPEQTIKAIV